VDVISFAPNGAAQEVEVAILGEQIRGRQSEDRTKVNNVEPDAMEKRTPLHMGRSLLMLLLLGLAVHFLLPQITELKQSLQVLQKMIWWVVILAIVAQFLSYVGSGYLLKSIVEVVGDRMRISRGVLITLASWSLGLVAGGTVGIVTGTYQWSRESGVSPEGATLAGWLPNFLITGSLILISIFGLLHLIFVHQLSALQVFGFSLMSFLLALIMVALSWGVHHRQSLTGWVVRAAGRWAKMLRRKQTPDAIRVSMDRIFKAWDTLRTEGWRRPLLGTILNFGFDMLTLYLLFVAAGHDVSPGVLLTGYGLPLLLGKVPFLPGGVGLVEGSMAALYAGLGVPNAITVVVILAYRVLSFWLPSLIGFPVILYLQRTGRRARHNS
jgi:uncharacterized protein (TIRG00374 family)